MPDSSIRIMSGALALLLAVPAAHAAEAVTTTPTVIVSATRTAETVDETLAPVSVITRADIERLQARSVADVLRGLPGVSLVNNGGAGKNTTLFLRGAESDQVLVLIDGVKAGDATSGLFKFQDFPIEQIERIEVVRGPRASLYGSEAIGGVVQIFTRKGGGELTPFARVSAGSRRTGEAAAGVSGGGERGWFSLSGSGFSTDGFDSCRAFAGCFVVEPDEDGFRNRSLAARGGYRLSDRAEVELHALATSGDNEFDGSIFAGNQSDQRQRIIGAKLGFSPLERWQVTLRGGRSRDEIDSFKDGVFVSEFLTRRDSFTLQNDVALGDAHLVTAGFDWQRDGIDSSVAFPVRSRWNKAVFAQYQGGFGAHDVQLAYRHDRNQQFGAANTGSVAWGLQFHPAARVVASFGNAFKAPTFNELFFPFFGDPGLEPERSRTAELSFRGASGTTRWSVGVFRSAVENLIGFDPVTFFAVNVGEATITGLEATLATRLLDFDVDASLTVLDPRNREAGANSGNLLPRRARQVARVDVDRRFGRLGLGATVLAQGHRFDDPANTRRLGGYTTVDLRAEYRIAKAWTAQARVENVLDKDFETAAFFNQPGRGVFFTLRYQP